MGIYVNPGNEKFMSAIRSKIYVDKTRLLEYTNSVIDTEQRYLCVSRPRRFGKSIAASMLAAYYSTGCNSTDIFDRYLIGNTTDYKQHLNHYPVIHVDLNDFRHRLDFHTGELISPSDTVRLFHSEIISELKEYYPDTLDDKDINLPTALAKIHAKYGDKFIIIIDEWDTIFREDKEDLNAQKLYITLLRGLFKDNNSKQFLALGYLTGILPIKKYGTESALNNFDEFTMLRPGMLAEYIGFTEPEVQQLCRKYHMDFEEAKRWYDGYSFSKISHIYSPNSVVKAMLYGEYSNFWTSTETYESLKNYITMNFDGLKSSIIAMLTGEKHKLNPNKFQNDMISFHAQDDILALLIHLGYLAYNAKTQEAYIPNEEVRREFQNAVEETGWDEVVKAIVHSENLLQSTWEKDEEAIATSLAEIHMNNTSILKYNDENSLACVITLAYYNAMNDYTIIRELPAGKGFADMVFLPRRHSDKPAMIIELKYNQSALTAIDQIKEKHYTNALTDYTGTLLLVGINYNKDTKQHTCKIEEVLL